MATIKDVAKVAREAGEAGDRGLSIVEIRGVTFDLQATSWCARFVRMVHEAAMGLRPFEWPYQSANALQMEAKLKANGLQVSEALAGDIVALNRNSGPHGHIGIYLGGGKFAENTSSRLRGPGTTISNLAQMPGRATGYYRALPTGQFHKLIWHADNSVLGWIEAPPVEADTQYEFLDRRSHDGKYYLRKL